MQSQALSILFPNLLLLFILAVLVGYYIDYKKDEKKYGKKSKGWLYLTAIILVAITFVYFLCK